MRFPPNLKYLIGFILAIGLVVLGTIYLPKLIPNIGSILIGIISMGMMIIVAFIVIKPFFAFLYARADGIFEVYINKSEKGFHLFSYHLNSSGEGYGESTRDIQHYFIQISNGKIYYNKLFTHLMVPATGRSGWGTFYGFEESVLKSKELPLSMHKLSAKSNMDLQLGRSIKSIGEAEYYEIHQDEYFITIKKYSNAADEGYKVICKNKNSDKQLWKKKI